MESTPSMSKMDAAARARLGHRAKQRRLALGLSCREVGDLAGMGAASVGQWEKMIPHKRTHDEKWESALQVPARWLRDSEMPAPPLANPIFNASSSDQDTFAGFIKNYCIWHAKSDRSERTLSTSDLSQREMRIVSIMVRRYGSEGEERATLQAIGHDLGLTRERVRQVEEKAIAQFEKVELPVQLIERLRIAFSDQLPCRLSELPASVLQLLGPTQSLEGADRFLREVLGERLVSIRAAAGSLSPQDKMVVEHEGAGDDLMRAVRQASTAMIRYAGAAQIYYVTGVLAEQGMCVSPAQVRQCARMFPGFEWLVEEEGWFWYGRRTDNRAKWTALKVLSVANRPVDIEELYGAMARARFGQPGDRVGPASTAAPMRVLQIVLSKFIEIQRSHFNDFRIASAIADNAAAAYLSGSEILICQELIERGGVASRRTLVRQLVDTGRMEAFTLSMALMSSPIFRRQDRGIWAITGYSFSHQDLQRAQEEKHQLQMTDGWYNIEVALPKSAFERGDWFAPAAAVPYLSPGEYRIEGIEGATRYVENAVGDPYLKSFAHLISRNGFEVSTPYMFGISASQRLLRLLPLQEEDEQIAAGDEAAVEASVGDEFSAREDT